MGCTSSRRVRDQRRCRASGGGADKIPPSGRLGQSPHPALPLHRTTVSFPRRTANGPDGPHGPCDPGGVPMPSGYGVGVRDLPSTWACDWNRSDGFCSNGFPRFIRKRWDSNPRDMDVSIDASVSSAGFIRRRRTRVERRNTCGISTTSTRTDKQELVEPIQTVAKWDEGKRPRRR